MDDLNYYRSICPSELAQLPVVNLYKELISGKRKALPSGTWEKDENVIILVRYALEVHLGLKKEQIPKINRVVIKKQKLQNIRDRLEWHLQREGIRIEEIPQKVNRDLLVKWGFSNPLKRYGYSPFRLMSALYPGIFKETDFKKIPQGYAGTVKNFV